MNVKIKNLSKIYNDVKAVDDLSVDIEDGSLVSILGPSGCGKSTLLYMISGIEKPYGGDIYFGEERVNDIPIEKRNIGLVFQNYSLYPHMTVKVNLMFPLRMNRIKKREASEKAEEISRFLKIQELLNRKPKELSGGQQQRVAIGRALIKKPSLLLMDEPFSNLDASLRVEMRDEIKALQKSFAITTLFVTHDQEEAMAISDKILLMNRGKVVQYSRGLDLYHKPNSIFTASFIGNPKINIIEDRELIKILESKDYTFNSKAIGIRPEDIVIQKINPHKDEGVTGTIIGIQALGKETHISIDLNRYVLKAAITGNMEVNLGDNVTLGFKKIHTFEV